ncbi:unnamed protein product, partial [Trypanosoma congolense IL3000]
MLPHPILASDDDKHYVRESILSLPNDIASFFTSLEQIYTEGRSEEAKRAFATYHTIQTTFSVLCRVPASSFRSKDDNGNSYSELHERIHRMGHLFLSEVVVVGPQAIHWKVPVMRLAEEAAQQMRSAYIEFPFLSVLLRGAVSYNSVAFSLSIAVFVSSILLALVVLIAVPLLSPSTTVGLLVGAGAFFFLCLNSAGFIYLYVMSTKALQSLYTWILEERMHSVLLRSLTSRGDTRAVGPVDGVDPLQVTRGYNTRSGYYTIPYSNTLGYIEGKHVDAQVVMIGFDEKYRITRWNIGAEVMTGFLESGCLGKPLSDLVITPTGDVERDLAPLQVSSGEILKLKLRAFATVPVTLFTVAVPVLNQGGNLIGRMLICANVKDNLGEHRSYIRDYVISEVDLSLCKIVKRKTVAPEGLAVIRSLRSFLKYGFGKQVESLARGMLAEWEWTTSEQLLGQVLRLSPLGHRTLMDSVFPGTLCLHPSIPEVIASLLNNLDVPCNLRVQVLSSAANIFTLEVAASPVSAGVRSGVRTNDLREKLLFQLRNTCGSMCNDDEAIVLRF